MKNLLFVILPLTCSISLSQDIHFTQFYNAPTLLNPAKTGHFDEDYRFALNHRTQWKSVTVPYRTNAFTVDGKTMTDKVKNGNAVGIGIFVFSDQSGDGQLTELRFMMSGGFTKNLNKKKTQKISIGTHVGVYQKTFNPDALYFESQFENGDFNTDINSNEDFTRIKILRPDIHSGIDYQNNQDDYKFNTGVSFNHILKTNTSLINGIDPLSLRTNFYSVLRINMGSGVFIGPDILYTYQNKAREFLIGGTVEYPLESVFEKPSTLYSSLQMRYQDAYSIVGGIQYEKWTLSLSYDFNISQLRVVSDARGGFEIALINKTRILSGNRKPHKIPCFRL